MRKGLTYNLKNKSQGFTLMEVILAITILATLSMLVTTSLTRALKSKRKIQTEVQDVSTLRDTIKVMRADIYQAYNHYDFEKAISDESKKTQAQTQQNPYQAQNPYATTPAGPQRENKREDPSTQFIGTEKDINFVTLNNGRYMANEIQADFIEVGYFLKDCKSLTSDSSSSCLYRRVQKIIDNDVTKGGTESVLLENVKDFKLRYIGDGKQEWVKEWKTQGGIDDSTKSLFPDAVEINLAIERDMDGKKREYSLQYVVPLHFPNNIKKSNAQSSTGGSAAPPPVGF